jgi:rfaE bifunctional protein nucleotidyltransferase chain/domain
MTSQYINLPDMIEHWTANILQRYERLTGCSLPLPVPILDIAERLFALRCDVENLRGKLEHASGALIADKRWVILNKRQSLSRRSFTLAHELAHWLIDHEEFEQGEHGLEHISGSRCKEESLREIRANQVAAALLMPKHMILTEASRYAGIGDAEMAELAFTFGVSQEAMRIRLSQLREDLPHPRSLLLFSERRRRETFASSYHPNSSSTLRPKAAMVKVYYAVLDHALYRKLLSLRRDCGRLYVLLDDQDDSGIDALLDLDCVDGLLRIADDRFRDLEREHLAKPDHATVFTTIVTGKWLEKLQLEKQDKEGSSVSAHVVTLRSDGSAQVRMRPLLNLAWYIEPPQKLRYRKDARLFIRNAQASGKRVVIVTGCFDLLTRSHVEFLKRAKESGDVLVVGIEDDTRVRAFKGPLRPVNTVSQRVEVIDALECVDFTFVISGSPKVPLKEFYTRLHRKIRADILVVTEGDPHLQDRRAEIEAAGGQLVVMRRLDGNTTTSLIRQFLAEVEYSDMLLVSKRQLEAYATERKNSWLQLRLPLEGLDGAE